LFFIVAAPTPTRLYSPSAVGGLNAVYGPPPTDERYCINGVALNFKPEKAG
jgi:peptide methionine sulfoxide reductase MsrB